MTGFVGQVARGYEETRYIPSNVAEELVSDAVGACSISKPQYHIADVGCGTGRFLRALAKLNGVSELYGLDLSRDMLREAEPLRSGSNVIRLFERDCSIRGGLEGSTYDLILLHWVLNTTERWYDLLGNCVHALRPGGVLLSFEESGSLYSAIDGDIAAFDHSLNGIVAHEAWEEFCGGLGDWGTPSMLQGRNGLPVCSRTSVDAIADYGLRITSMAGARRSWSKIVTTEWLLGSVVVPRMFSNLWRIPGPVYDRAVRRLSKWVQAHPYAACLPIIIQYSATPLIAVER